MARPDPQARAAALRAQWLAEASQTPTPVPADAPAAPTAPVAPTPAPAVPDPETVELRRERRRLTSVPTDTAAVVPIDSRKPRRRPPAAAPRTSGATALAADPEVETDSGAVQAAAAADDTLALLRAMRDVVAKRLDNPTTGATAVPQLYQSMMKIQAEIEERSGARDDDADEAGAIDDTEPFDPSTV